MASKSSTVFLDHIERLKLAKSYSKMGFYDWYPLENRIIWDDVLHNITGLDINSKKERPIYFMSIIHPDDLDQVAQHMQDILDPKYHGDTFDNEFRMVLKGKTMYIKTIGIRERDDSGLVSRIFGIVIDNTLNITSQQRIAQNEERLRMVIEATGFATYDFKVTENQVFWDERMHELFGLSQDSKKGRNEHFFSCLHPDDLDRVTANFERNFDPKYKETHSYDEFRIIVNKKTKYVRNHGTVFRDSKNHVFRITGSLFDVTDLKKVEQELEESREYFKNIFEGSSDHIFTIDKRRKVVFINKVAPGLTMEQVIGTDVLDFVIPHERDKVRDHLNKLFKEAVSVEYETTFPSPDRLIYYSTKVNPLVVNGSVTGAIFISRDITESKESEKRLLEQSKELQISNQNLEQFAYVSSHDIKAPATNLEGLVNIMDEENFVKEEGKVIFDKLKSTVHQMKQTIQSLNEVFSVQSNLNLPKKKIEFESSLKEVLGRINLQIEESEAKIIYDFKLAPKCVFAKTHLKNILQNLIINSIKYRQEGVQPVIKIKSKIHKKTDRIQLDISDNGRGINMEKYGDKIFGLFQRFHLDTEGKGLGLHIIKMIIESYGGEISVKSDVNKGTSFTLIF